MAQGLGFMWGSGFRSVFLILMLEAPETYEDMAS